MAASAPSGSSTAYHTTRALPGRAKAPSRPVARAICGCRAATRSTWRPDPTQGLRLD